MARTGNIFMRTLHKLWIPSALLLHRHEVVKAKLNGENFNEVCFAGLNAITIEYLINILYTAGLEVIANNGELFNKELFIHYDQWYKDLILWSKSSNTNDSSVGKRAMFSYLKAIFGYATSITQQVEDEEKLRSGPFDKFVNVSSILFAHIRTIFNNFIWCFSSTLSQLLKGC